MDGENQRQENAMGQLTGWMYLLFNSSVLSYAVALMSLFVHPFGRALIDAVEVIFLLALLALEKQLFPLFPSSHSLKTVGKFLLVKLCDLIFI